MINTYFILGNNEQIINKSSSVLNDLGYSKNEEINESVDVFCYVYCHEFKDSNGDDIDYVEVNKVFELMKNSKKGKCILITNFAEDSIIYTEKDSLLCKEAGLLKWWRIKAAELAYEGIQSNVLNIGNIYSNEDDFNKVSDWMIIKRSFTDEDLFYGIKVLVDNDLNYMVGQQFNLNGGITNNPLKPILENELSSVKTVDSTEGSTVLIIGASSGIGRETARLLVKNGANVVLFARRLEKLEEIKEELKGYKANVFIESVDVTDVEKLSEAIDGCFDKYGKIDSLVYTAGYFDGENMLKSDQKWDKIWDTNMMGYMHSVRTYINCCKTRKVRGNIVGIASIGGYRAILPNVEAYGVSKASMVHFAKSVALGYSKYGIRINNIAPGWVETAMTEFLTTEYKNYWLNKLCIKRPASPNEIATLVRYMISDESSYMSGETIAVDGGVLLGQI